jgi:hypothetical protein
MTRPDRMKRRLAQIGVALALVVSTAAIAAPADARDRYHSGGLFSFGFSTPGYYYEPAPRYYYAPAPRYYYAPPPPAYYYAPPPAYYYEPGPSFNFGLGFGTNR